MKNSITIIFLFFCLSTFAQEDVVEYKQYEVLAKKINDIQRLANGKRLYNDGTDVLLNIPENNFFFNYHNQRVSLVNKIDDVLIVSDNIDLKSVKEIGILDESFGDYGMITIETNKKYRYTTVKNGKPEYKEKEVVQLYFPFSDRAKGTEMFECLSEIILLVQVKNGILTATKAKQQRDKWRETTKKNTAIAYYHYWKNEPNNIFNRMAYYKLTKLDRSFELENLKTGNFYFKIPESKISAIIDNRSINYKTEDKTLKKIREKYKFMYKYNSDEKLYVSNTRPAYYALLDFITEKKLDENLEKITEMMNTITLSENNQLLDIFPQGYRIGLLTHFVDHNNPKKEQLEFWIESGDKSPIDFYKMAGLLKHKYGSDQNKIDPSNDTLFIRLEGYGEKFLVFRNKLSNSIQNLPYRAYIIIAYKR